MAASAVRCRRVSCAQNEDIVAMHGAEVWTCAYALMGAAHSRHGMGRGWVVLTGDVREMDMPR